MERGWKPNVEISPPCPRCGSCKTKFCYYNNYSLTQPRYFCKGCRRYWTKGGSLRDVPVGGGCRRSRRGKSIRISTDRVPSRSLADGGVRALGHSIGTSSSMVSEGPNIDLALVYANFLNQQPESSAETRIEMPQQLGSGGIDPSFEFASVVDMQHMEFSTHLLLENEVIECPNLSDLSLATHLSNGNGNGMYDCGFNSIHKQQETLIQQFRSSNIIHTSNYGLPPLPGEEEKEEEVVVSDQEMAWSNNPQMMDSSHMLHVTQPPPIQSEAQDPDQLNIGDRASYQLSSYGTFFRP